jgi:SAM-dependent methyltransferase
LFFEGSSRIGLAVSLPPNHALRNDSAVADHEEACARVAALFDERWLRIYVGHKLRSDPVFPTAFQLLCNSQHPLIDLGCGVGLLAFYLRERNYRNSIRGIDCDGRKITRAKSVASKRYGNVFFTEQDVGDSFTGCGDIVISDLLHYLSPNEQVRLLENVGTELAPGGRLIIRDCPDDGNARSWLTHLAERFAQSTTWNVKTPLHFPPRDRIMAAFKPAEFSRTVKPLWGKTLFNNHLFVFERRAAVSVPA